MYIPHVHMHMRTLNIHVFLLILDLAENILCEIIIIWLYTVCAVCDLLIYFVVYVPQPY